MSKIRVKNFGPIKGGYYDSGAPDPYKEWMEIKKVTAFIGNQGSGKSTVAKLISTFSWMEKALIRGDYDSKYFMSYNRFKKTFCAYHRLENYFLDENGNDIADIAYQGDTYTMYYRNGKLQIVEDNLRNYSLPQIMYVPAERNFITYVKTPKELKLSSDSLIEFLTEFDKAKFEMKGLVKLPINNVDIEYDKLNDTLNLKGVGYKVKLTEASSGFQSLVPLFLVSGFLANSVKKQSESSKEPMSSEEMERFKKGVAEIWNNESFTEEQRRIALNVLSSKFNKTAFINIVEEPEQNLFPSSQWEMLKSLLEFNTLNDGNKLIMTTHSPYIVNYLSIAIQGDYLIKKIEKSTNSYGLEEKLGKVIPAGALIGKDDFAIYQLDESNGTISRLPNPTGIPSDNNYLNKSLRHGNEMFDSLLEIEQEL